MQFLMWFSWKDKHSEYANYAHLLSEGSWIFGGRWKLDNTDRQYAGFRNNFPVLAVVLVVYLCLSWAVRATLVSGMSRHIWLGFLLCFSLGFIGVLHGVSGLSKILGLLAGNYVVIKIIPPSAITIIIIWLISIVILFANDWNRGYRFAQLSPSLAFLVKVFQFTLAHFDGRIMNFIKDYCHGGIFISIFASCVFLVSPQIMSGLLIKNPHSKA